MIATVHAADVGAAGTLRSVLGRPKVSEVPGLRWADVAVLAPLAMSGPPPVGRPGLIAFWDDEASVDRFLDTHPTGGRLAGGLEARLRPLRAFGSWRGLPADLPTSRAVPHDGPVVVLTLGRLRLSQTVRFLRTSRPAERSADDPDMLWGTAGARPPFVATVSIWRSSQASAAYAFAKQRPQHSDAIAEQQRKDFHKQSAFIRFAPLRLDGELTGRNPLSTAGILA